MKYLNKLLLSSAMSAITVALLTACASNRLIPVTQPEIPGDYISHHNGQWLSVSKDDSARFNTEKIADISAEYLDQRHHNGQPSWLTLNHKHQLVFIQQQQHQWRISVSNALDTAIEGLCLYQPGPEQSLQAFLLTQDHQAQQVLLQPQQEQLKITLLRTLPLPGASEFCVVDDENNALYVTEEQIGLWRYDARVESDLRRHVVAMVQPHGPLHQVGPLARYQEHIYMAPKGGDQLYHFHKDRLQQQWHIPSLAADGLAIASLNKQLNALLLDENTHSWQATKLPEPSSATADANIVELKPSAETEPVMSMGDAADDPAIWVHPTRQQGSRILATDKQYGLWVYDLQGKAIQQLAVGRVNNVDLRSGFTLQGQAMDIAAASQRDHAAIALLSIQPHSGEVSLVSEIATDLDNVYGLCMYRGNNNAMYVFINDEDGRYQQWHIRDSEQGWHASKVREFALASQPEGCSGDDVRRHLFLAEENAALYVMEAEPSGSDKLTVIGRIDDGWLHADIEGMEVYDNGKSAYLLVSSQGNDSFVLYSAKPPYQPLTRFRIGMNLDNNIDGASETDGLTVSSANLGPGYEQGLIVVQDGRNLLPKQRQNFKLVPWQAVVELLP